MCRRSSSWVLGTQQPPRKFAKLLRLFLLVFLVQAIAWNDQRDVLSNGFLCGIAEQALSALVPTRNDTIQILAHNGIVGRSKDGSQQSGCFFGPSLCRDIDGHAVK